MHTNASPRRLVAALTVTALLITGAACSAEGDDTATTTTAAGDDGTTSTTATTTSGDDGTTTTDPTGSGDPSDLEALLPTEDDLPADYVEVPSDDDDDDDDSSMDDAIAESCPDAAEILEALGDNDDENADQTVTRDFEAEDDRSIEVRVRPAHSREVPVDDLIDAYNSCDVLQTDLNGYPTEIAMEASALDIGDDAVRLTMDISIDDGSQILDVTLDAFLFRRDGVSVQVNAQSGFDSTGAVTPVDSDVAEQLAADIDEAIQAR
jgi:hypothetical protein